MGLFGKKYVCKVYIEGMTCQHCASRVEAAFNELKGASARVDLEENVAYITCKKVITGEKACEIVEKAGFVFKKLV